MSRIEKAIEKATQIRESAGGQGPQLNRSAAAKMPVLSQQLATEPLTVRESSLVCALPDYHPVAEEYKKLKSQILLMTKGKRFLNTLMVTSSLSEEGKSVTALNLAVTMARDYDHSVLLVDADLRRPAVHKYLNFDPGYGLLQCLRDGAPLEGALVKTGLGKLVVLPAGGVAEDPVELLASDQMKSLVVEMKHRYPERYIIIDTPPTLLFAEAQALSSVADGVLFVVREGVAKIAQIRQALAALQGANLLGVIYNDAFLVGRKKKYYDYY
ncbi:MAG TPA: XrtA-associated tyrosine autokinase [bacterium]|nr:XrtA-associated tyrosine autokinase [bacterium]